MTYSIDFRKKVLSMKKKERLSFDQISKRLGVSKSAIWYALKRLQVTYKKTLRYPKAQETQRQQHLSKIDQ